MDKEQLIKFKDALDEIFIEIQGVLITKGQYYGHEVLRVTGETGIIVRLFDKLYRLKNIVIDNPDVIDPEDTWLDLLGYSILGILMHRGFFNEVK